jgi:hypothetical protein
MGPVVGPEVRSLVERSLDPHRAGRPSMREWEEAMGRLQAAATPAGEHAHPTLLATWLGTRWAKSSAKCWNCSSVLLLQWQGSGAAAWVKRLAD